jgi:uncharacterized lipoprotein YddW (UPF0748 family)
MLRARLRASSRAPLLLAAFILTACADTGPTAPGSASFSQGTEGLTLTASHESARVVIRDSLRLQVLVTNPAGKKIPHTRNLTWATSDASVATVDSMGLVHGVAVGEARVTVTHENGRWADTVPVTVIWPEEARALWVNRFEWGATLGPAGGTAKIIEILDRAKQANFNIVYFQVRGEGDAYYRSSLEPCTFRLCGTLGNGQPSWDPLEVAVREAHARGIELHAWLNAVTGWSSPNRGTFSSPKPDSTYCARLVPSKPGSPNHMLIDHPEWAMVSSTGVVQSCLNSMREEYAYVSAGIPAVRTHLARVAADIARRYRVDGIHLDRIRYPGTSWSYDAPSLAAFQALHGRAPTSTTGDAAWSQFRRDMVNLTVKEAYDSINAARPSVVLSAAVWGIYDDLWGWRSSRGVSQYLQDPRAWARAGYLDVAVPMTYYNTHSTYCGFADWACLLDDHMKGYEGSGRHLYISISPAQPATKTNAMVLDQIALGRAKGIRGFAFYSYNAMNSRSLWPVLASGPFKEPASVPYQDWQ